MKRLIVLAAMFLSACTDPKEATKQLDSAGYSDIQMTGYAWFACSKDDAYHTGFLAKGPTGKPVKGVVCSGLLFKGATIRFD